MKILEITSDYIPNPLWGMGWHVNQLVIGLRKRKQDIWVATAFKSANCHKQILTTKKNIDRKYLSKNSFEIFDNFNNFNLWQDALAKEVLCSHKHFDIIHCHNWMSWITAKEIKKTNPYVKIVITFHFLQKQYEIMKENPIPTFHKEIVEIEQDAIDNADKVVVLSNSQFEFINDKYKVNHSDQIVCLPHSVNYEIIPYEKLRQSKENNKYIDILFIGRVEKDKGIRETLEAFLTLEKFSNVRLNIVGDGPLLKSLKTKYKEKQIIFYGYLQRKDLEKLLMKSHIFCMPSSSENLPLTVLEAMFFGVVPIFTSGKMVPNIFENNKQGFTVPLQFSDGAYRPQISNIHDCLNRLIKNEKLRNRMAFNAYELAVEKYSKDSMIDNILKLYTSLAK